MPDRRVAVVIPARWGSTRFPGKVLAPLLGRPMIAQVVERARAAKLPAAVFVATDDERIAEAATAAGAQVRRTSSAHPSGTDRVAEVARELEAEILVNLQADEPLVPPAAIDRAAEPLLADKALDMATLAHRVDVEAARDPNLVKVVCDRRSNALYFSRHPIPYIRDWPGLPERSGLPVERPGLPERSGLPVERPGLPLAQLRHIGIYAYRRDVLLRLAEAPPTPLELAEGLEQLRALELGFTIRVQVGDWTVHGVDTPADLKQVEALLRAGAGAAAGRG